MICLEGISFNVIVRFFLHQMGGVQNEVCWLTILRYRNTNLSNSEFG